MTAKGRTLGELAEQCTIDLCRATMGMLSPAGRRVVESALLTAYAAGVRAGRARVMHFVPFNARNWAKADEMPPATLATVIDGEGDGAP